LDRGKFTPDTRIAVGWRSFQLFLNPARLASPQSKLGEDGLS
jgi:hypothetical protein